MTSCCTSLPWLSPLALSFQTTVISPTWRSGFGDTERTRQTLGHHLLAPSQRLYVLPTQRDCEHGEKEFDFYFLCPRTTKTVLGFIVCHNTLAWRHLKNDWIFKHTQKQNCMTNSKMFITSFHKYCYSAILVSEPAERWQRVHMEMARSVTGKRSRHQAWSRTPDVGAGSGIPSFTRRDRKQSSLPSAGDTGRVGNQVWEPEINCTQQLAGCLCAWCTLQGSLRDTAQPLMCDRASPHCSLCGCCFLC